MLAQACSSLEISEEMFMWFKLFKDVGLCMTAPSGENIKISKREVVSGGS